MYHPEKWLKLVCQRSNAMHDTCDANLVFADALAKCGLIPDAENCDEEYFPEWNAVCGDGQGGGRLERAAQRLYEVLYPVPLEVK